MKMEYWRNGAPSKLGASCGVKVPAWQGVACHPYRVLRVWRRSKMIEQNMRSVHREACGPQGRPHSPKPNAASSNTTKRSATVSLHWKPTQRNRGGMQESMRNRGLPDIGHGRDSGGAAGVLTGRGTYAEKHQELGRPRECPEQGAACRSVSGRKAEPETGRPTMRRGESDCLIVLGGRESRPHGKGGNGDAQFSKETWTGQSGRAYHANLTEKNSGQGGEEHCSRRLRKRAFPRSPVREFRTPGSVRGASGNWRSYRPEY